MPLAELLAKAESDFEERWKAGQARRLLLLDPASLTAPDAPPPTPPLPPPPGGHAPVSWSPRR
jgi:hypothetical protein